MTHTLFWWTFAGVCFVISGATLGAASENDRLFWKLGGGFFLGAAIIGVLLAVGG